MTRIVANVVVCAAVGCAGLRARGGRGPVGGQLRRLEAHVERGAR